jgi:hypothetical protein
MCICVYIYKDILAELKIIHRHQNSLWSWGNLGMIPRILTIILVRSIIHNSSKCLPGRLMLPYFMTNQHGSSVHCSPNKGPQSVYKIHTSAHKRHTLHLNSSVIYCNFTNYVWYPPNLFWPIWKRPSENSNCVTSGPAPVSNRSNTKSTLTRIIRE